MANLHIRYDAVTGAGRKTDDSANELRQAFNSINAAMIRVEGSLKGKAGRALMQYWNSDGRRHSLHVIARLEKLSQKEAQIAQLIEQTDEEMKPRFNLSR